MEKTFDYNTQRKKLVLPEYGRNVQKMVNHLATIEDRTERNKAAKTIISVMGNMNPHLRDISDFKHKLWDHLALRQGGGIDN
jgi:CRISPR/Cas system-associated endonuclease Cas1